MQILTTILAILKLLLVAIPEFLKVWEKYKKDSAYKTATDKIDAAIKEYNETPSVENLKKLEKSQK